MSSEQVNKSENEHGNLQTTLKAKFIQNRSHLVAAGVYIAKRGKESGS